MAAAAGGQTNYAATGATAGAAFGPWGAVIGGVVGFAADMASQKPPAGNFKASTQNNLAFDNSGWNVAFPDSNISSNSTSSNTQGGAQSQTQPGIAANDPYGMAGAVGGSSTDTLFGTSLGFDNSGWNVAFPNSTINSSATKSNTQGGAQNAGPAVPGFAGSNFSYAVLIIGAVVAIKWLKHKHA